MDKIKIHYTSEHTHGFPFMAWVEGHKAYWSAGSTPEQAIGNAIMGRRFDKEFPITVINESPSDGK